MSAASLELAGVGHSVPAGAAARRALYRGLDARLAPGELTAVIGPNGAGKTTLLRQLAGLAPPEQGEVRLGGQPLRALAPRQRARRIAYLPQHTPLAFDLRVDDVVMLGRAPHLGRFAAPGFADRAAVAAALAAVGDAGLAGRSVSSLSGGERQRVMLARLLATGAPILVLDEPTTALDIGHTLGFLELCRRLAGEGRTVIMAMHELDLCRRYADAVLCLTGDAAHHAGPVAAVMTPEILERVFAVGVRQSDGLQFFVR